MYNTSTPLVSSDTHIATNYYLNIQKIQTLAAYATDILFREDSSSTLAKFASTSAFNTVRDNIVNNRAWFYNTHGTSTLSGWLVGVNGGNIPDAQLSYCNNYSSPPATNPNGQGDTTETSLTTIIFDSCGNGNGSHAWLNKRLRLRGEGFSTLKVHSIWFKIQ
jgi:hypothetical protein